MKSLVGGTWPRFMARAAVLCAMICAAVVVGIRIANAGPGDPVRKALTVSGTLGGVSGTITAMFRFYRAMGDVTPLCAPEVTIRDGMEREAGSGAFSVEVPLDQSGAGRTCPDTLFHDPSAFVEVVISGTTVVARRPINPVPYAAYAQQYGTPDCPAGWSRLVTEPASGFSADRVRRLCVRRGTDGAIVDMMVRVGQGPSAFWIDRFEATVVDRAGVQYGIRGAETFPGLPRNGQWYPATNQPPLFAVSNAGLLPSANITWFQASELCRASGKQLPTGDQWLAAASGTVDSESQCAIGAISLRPSNVDTNCVSAWGAADLVGSVWEWTSEWFATLNGNATASPTPRWPTESGDYRDDLLGGIVSAARPSRGDSNLVGLPAAALRGGSVGNGTAAGVFAVLLDRAPSGSYETIGFRCVIPR